MVRLAFHSLHQLVASVISLATRFLCSASKSHPALILLLLAPEPDSLRWIPVRIRDENIQIVHALQSQLTDFDKKSVSFYFQLAAELHRAGIFDIIQPERSDWRFVMKWQKKQYRPIAGQTWYEKVLDWITREENFKWLITGIGLYVTLMLLVTYISANVLKQKGTVDVFFKVWLAVFPVVVAIVLFNPLSTAWAFCTEKKLQKLIKDYLAAHNRCIYDEMVAYCMPIKIHLGIDSAIEKMLQCHELVWEDGCYRLPT